MKRVHLEFLRRAAAIGGEDYLADCVASGMVSQDRQFLFLSDEVYLKLRRRYTPKAVWEKRVEANRKVCLGCEHFWPEQDACALCRAAQGMFAPWDNLNECPAGRWR
jgi:hypothetical protein